MVLDQVIIYSSYKNKKTGSRYQVMGFAKHSETGEELVLYIRVGLEQVWARPIELFKEKFEEL